MLDENVSPAAHQPDSRAVGQPLVTLVLAGVAGKPQGSWEVDGDISAPFGVSSFSKTRTPLDAHYTQLSIAIFKSSGTPEMGLQELFDWRCFAPASCPHPGAAFPITALSGNV
eukprot:894759-Pelagomonas_calceolata.AAC.1